MYKIDKVQLPAAGVCAEPFDEYMNIAKHEYHIAKHEYHIASCVIDFEILYIRSNYFLCTAGASYV